MAKVRYENGVRIEVYGSKEHPMIFIGEGPYSFKIEHDDETNIYLFNTEAELDEFAQEMKKLYPGKDISSKHK